MLFFRKILGVAAFLAMMFCAGCTAENAEVTESISSAAEVSSESPIEALNESEQELFQMILFEVQTDDDLLTPADVRLEGRYMDMDNPGNEWQWIELQTGQEVKGYMVMILGEGEDATPLWVGQPSSQRRPVLYEEDPSIDIEKINQALEFHWDSLK